jgi:hypothetical protein
MQKLKAATIDFSNDGDNSPTQHHHPRENHPEIDEMPHAWDRITPLPIS